MNALLRLPRIWWLAITMPVVVAAIGITFAVTNNSKPTANVLGEKITGSGSSSTPAPPTSNPGGNGSPNGSSANANNTTGNGNANGNGGNGNGNGNGGSPGHAFTISGGVESLYPGGQGKLYLTVTNPNNQAITVTSLSATLQAVTGAAGCSATTANITISPYSGPAFDVDKNASKLSTGYIPVTLPMSTANACQGATYNLTYSGTAVQK